MTVLIVVASAAMLLGLVVGFIVGSRNAHRMVARLSPPQRVAFAKKVSAAVRDN